VKGFLETIFRESVWGTRAEPLRALIRKGWYGVKTRAEPLRALIRKGWYGVKTRAEPFRVLNRKGQIWSPRKKTLKGIGLDHI
jgi:hypothetical protein